MQKKMFRHAVWDMPVLSLFRENILQRSIEKLNTGWEDTLVPLGMVLAGEQFGDTSMLAWSEAWAEYHLSTPVQRPREDEFRYQASGDPTRGIYLTQYCGEWGCATVFAELYKLSPRETLREAVTLIADHICEGSIRVGDGVIGHGPWSKIPWVDTLYYTAVPLTRAFQITGNVRYAEQALEQCLLHAQYLRDPLTGCFFHENHISTGERTSWLWSRGNGWVIMSLADTLRGCPPATKGWSEVLEIYRSIVVGLLRLQQPCGLWRIVPENDEAHLETSGSIMIATGIVMGIEQGWINRSLAAYVMRTWWETLTWIDDQGRLMGCQTPAGAGGWETHKRSIMGERTYGTGSLLRFSAELRQAGFL